MWALPRKFQDLIEKEICTKIEEGSTLRIESFVAQRALLHDSRVRAFVTHGGYNSFNESMAAGKPVLVIPQMADQFYTAKYAERLDIGIAFQKNENDPVKLAKLIGKLVEEDGIYQYRARAFSHSFRIVDNEGSKVLEMCIWAGPDYFQLSEDSAVNAALQAHQKSNWWSCLGHICVVHVLRKLLAQMYSLAAQTMNV